MNIFTIKDLENLSGIKAHTIRIWEQRYDFLKPQRTGTNIRYYTNEELKTMMNIALLNKQGVKISRIGQMSSDDISAQILSLTNPGAQHERIINQLVSCMIDFDNDLFETCLNKLIASKGIDNAINDFIFPFLKKVGLLWMTNHIKPAQEHLVTSIVRQKLLVGIDSLAVGQNAEKKVLLFLPEGEHHELGLLYVHYLLKWQGVQVLYLGADLPLKDLETVVKVKKPTCIYTHLTSLAASFNMEKFMSNVQKYGGGLPFYVSGQVTVAYKKEVPASVHFKQSLEEVREFISSFQKEG